ncbi:TetR/AcrR family transcriptional regulator [Methylocella sp. CPCC 101449]|jgi:AcrR family transcriptional regulator|uniref:TetR/AcrR family transcriptional regulator n=1 Tax=Methylocella sp. CPCC 101449 TaxID=2987531 RepID=UPI0028913EBB|nr:TetR/AcrR family transcriptional regulator [Methylocella sp. CPCC 101449]MDT2020903.1 TetR/AcrR family transcriptional regulator [Methylocella sp. CPCC 101449]HEV2570843.1 TetR/AcrR family transcriptional regulator [Beijerinckiaceae bacterium]
METAIAATRKPRERIIEAACDLFRKHGIRGVGVDAIAEAADTNKMTLYRHFGSKDDLVVAWLREVEQAGETAWNELLAAHPNDPMARIQDWVGKAAECAVGDGRGCDMANTAIELTEEGHPARRLIQEFKIRHRERLVQLCRDAGIVEADLLADALYLLVEGARVTRQSVGVQGPCAHFTTVAQAVIRAFAQNNKMGAAAPSLKKAPEKQTVRA